MNATAALGFLWLILTAAIGHALVLVAAYHQIRRTLDLARIGEQREREDALIRQHHRLTNEQ